MAIWGKRVPGRGNSYCKGTEADMCWILLLFLEHVNVFGAQQERKRRSRWWGLRRGPVSDTIGSSPVRAFSLMLCDWNHQKVLSRGMIEFDYFLKDHSGCYVKNRW